MSGILSLSSLMLWMVGKVLMLSYAILAVKPAWLGGKQKRQATAAATNFRTLSQMKKLDTLWSWLSSLILRFLKQLANFSPMTSAKLLVLMTGKSGKLYSASFIISSICLTQSYEQMLNSQMLSALAWKPVEGSKNFISCISCSVSAIYSYFSPTGILSLIMSLSLKVRLDARDAPCSTFTALFIEMRVVQQIESFLSSVEYDAVLCENL